MSEKIASPDSIQHFYDLLGSRYDLFSFYEGQAKERALELLDLSPGHRVINVGIGTGKEHLKLQSGVGSAGFACGLDISNEMVRVAYERTGAPICRADARDLPFRSQSFDRLLATYILDLLPAGDLVSVISGFRRVLKPGGRMVLVSLTEGVNGPSKAIVGAWKLAFAVSPISCGGCRPLQLSGFVIQAGFDKIQEEVIVQLGVPSELIMAIR